MSELSEEKLLEQSGAAYEMMEGILLPDDERLPLCRDCADWDKIPSALAACAITVWSLLQHHQVRGAIGLMRRMAESLYALGYQRGQREARRPALQLVLAEAER